MSDPISPAHSSSCRLLAGRSQSSFAAQRVVAALPLPPPRPAPAVYYVSFHSLLGFWSPENADISTPQESIITMALFILLPGIHGDHLDKACIKSTDLGLTQGYSLFKSDFEILPASCFLTEKIERLQKSKSNSCILPAPCIGLYPISGHAVGRVLVWTESKRADPFEC